MLLVVEAINVTTLFCGRTHSDFNFFALTLRYKNTIIYFICK